ncbi:hypothetical protein [Saccharothrix luteola]|uniref:hypothetical protein n=1 Tax=Saccharothrix luteola TaxID=2893018 RepID=UPI001E56124C|nr:hypothetical protein [Saccharothrix luteola]MCC8242720.1 hypothetical protein [Saccharothrix luteola]
MEPGSFHDLRVARAHVLPALYEAARDRLPTLANEDRLLRSVRALGERTAAELEQRWHALWYVTISPSRIGAITRAALVLDNARH